MIITDGRSKSPFLEELERRQPLSAIDWADYPPLGAAANRRLVVRVKGNNPQAGTYAVRDLLKATRYSFHSIKKCWEKSFPVVGFSIDAIKAEVWTKQADGIEVRIFDDNDMLVACFLIGAGDWHCVVDQLETLCAAKTEPDGAIQT